MRVCGAIFACVALSGCTSAVSYVMTEYSGVPVKEVVLPDDTYRVFDKPAENKMMVTSSLSSAAGQGLASGVTLGMAPEPPKPLFEAAAAKFLVESGRNGCRLIDTYLLARPQWEVKYDCTPVEAARPADIVATRPIPRRTRPAPKRPANAPPTPAIQVPDEPAAD